MPCYYPLRAYRTTHSGKNGGPGIRFKGPHDPANVIDLPCGQCIGCRLERSRKWAVRCMHEASLYEDNCFITLTYDNEHLPLYGTLVKRDFVLFMKRLRKRFGSGVRFFQCGEYGDKYGRPHYHAILFNLDFPDKVLYSVRDGNNLFVSPVLNDLWGHGLCVIGAVTFDSAAYVARYVVKKRTGKGAAEHYTRVDSVTGEMYELVPEYATMSRRPGLAAGWFSKFSGDVYPSDFVVSRGHKMKPPRYYDDLYEAVNPYGMLDIRNVRAKACKESLANSVYTRLVVREKVQRAKVSHFDRSVDDDS